MSQFANDTLDSLPFQLANRSKTQVAIEVTLVVMLAVVSFFGNVLVVLVVTKFRHVSNSSSIFIGNLAVSDMIMAVSGMPFSMAVMIKGDWIGSFRLCEVNGFLMFSSANLSLMTLALIAIQRYVLVCHRLHYRAYFTEKKIRIYIAITWILPLFTSIPPLIGWGHYEFLPGRAMCLYPFYKSLSFTLMTEVVFIGTPLIVIHISYYKVFKMVSAHNQERQSTVAQGPGTSMTTGSIRVTKTLAMVVTGFVFCWTPVAVVDFYDLATAGTHLPRWLYITTTYLIFASSAINPIIYALSNPQFRKAFGNIIFWRGVPVFSNQGIEKDSSPMKNYEIASGSINNKAFHLNELNTSSQQI